MDFMSEQLMTRLADQWFNDGRLNVFEPPDAVTTVQ